MTADLVEQFSELLSAVGGTAHGPLPVDEALDLLVKLCRERAGGGAVALSTGDPVVQRLGVEEALGAAGFEVLTPDDVFWRERLAEAGVGVTGAVTAAAASGTVGIACGPRAPRATSLVPPAHICLVFRAAWWKTWPRPSVAVLQRHPIPICRPVSSGSAVRPAPPTWNWCSRSESTAPDRST